eukprot:CAMPEP_0182486808 /NCGR_PEP_ID=MMETSP1319-20130603/47583_1 /TAXON_ID=172717 /ORGANISM="Bolidomonas pacifica, Strain RCC208" /LENGTH=179 /DNA_ID=CAMNT_0024688913 /DNA_START=362 /DNA_END=902 /DNA_ORIENTATION=+
MENDKLMEELGVTVEDLDPKPTDAESKNTAVKDLKKKSTRVRKQPATSFLIAFDAQGKAKARKLMEELGVTVEDLDPKPTDAESKNTAVKDLKKKREEESSRLEKEVKGLWKTLQVSKDDQKAFKEKVEAAGKLKQAGLLLLKVEQERLEGMAAQKKEADDDVDEGEGEGEVGEGEGSG